MKLGIVLSGGGIRCVAQAGALEALKENSIQVDVISSVSAGSIVGALYAAGVPPKNIRDIFESTPIFKLSNYSLAKPGLIDIESFRSILLDNISRDDFDVLQIPLIIGATDLSKAKIQFFDSGQLIKPILASCALPFIFSPVEIEGKFYGDGGILNNFPFEPIRETCNHLIGIYVNPVKTVENKDLNNSFKVLLRSFEVSTLSSSYYKFPQLDLVINPPALNKFGMFSRKVVREIFDIGYEDTMEKMELIKQFVS